MVTLIYLIIVYLSKTITFNMKIAIVCLTADLIYRL